MAPHQVADYDDTLIPKEPVPFHGKTFIKTEPIPPTAQQNEQKPQRNWLMGEKAFKTSMPHHQGIKALWETKWKFPCTKSVYPFHDGAYEDFAPVFEHLIAHDINDGTSPEYTRAFFPVTEELEAAGDAAVQQGQAEKASELYLRAACVLRIARFPYISAHVSQQEDPDKWRAWEWQKKVYMKAAGQLWEPSPVVEVDIPHVYAANNDLGLSIPAYVRMPPAAPLSAAPGTPRSARSSSASPSPPGSPSLLWTLEGKEEEEQRALRTTQQKRKKSPPNSPFMTAQQHGKPVQECPVVILLTGLDGYRPDNTVRCNEFLARGWACVVLEIPGTADCPADPSDPAASERLWDSLFSWMRSYTYNRTAAAGTGAGTAAEDRRNGGASVLQKFDMARVLCWGLSAGGYHAIRIAHTHAAQLAGVVAQGAGSHYFFDREWIEYAEGHEYPFKLAPAMARKHGFDSVEEYKEKVQGRFSLLANGLLDPQGGSARLLLVNGMQDGLMPIEDSMLLFEHGSPKEARFFAAALHMGYPLANSAVYPWMEQVVASVVDKA